VVPKERLDVLSDALKKAGEDRQLQATLKGLWLYAPYGSGEEIVNAYRKRMSAWKPLIESMKADEAKK
jgi:tripartite-type tricarboxylate transporter receptor subunit TctC